ncbi:MAG: hypothetical protein WKF75_13325 [Singulisphaera sp.]
MTRLATLLSTGFGTLPRGPGAEDGRPERRGRGGPGRHDGLASGDPGRRGLGGRAAGPTEAGAGPVRGDSGGLRSPRSSFTYWAAIPAQGLRAAQADPLESSTSDAEQINRAGEYPEELRFPRCGSDPLEPGRCWGVGEDEPWEVIIEAPGWAS